MQTVDDDTLLTAKKKVYQEQKKNIPKRIGLLVDLSGLVYNRENKEMIKFSMSDGWVVFSAIVNGGAMRR